MSEFKPNGYFVDSNCKRIEVVDANEREKVVELTKEIAPFNPEDWGVDVLYLNGDTSGMTKDNAKDLTFVWGERSGNVNVKWQGSSSVQTGIEIGSKFDTELGGLFNFTLKFEEAFEAAEGWGVQKKYCFKANAIDHSHSRNLCSCKLWGQIVKGRKNVPDMLKNLPNGGAVDGFPMIIMLNGKYYALGTFNIPKDGWMFGNPRAILCADGVGSGPAFKGPATFNGDFKVEYIDDDDESWVLASINTAIQAVVDSDGSDLYTVVDQYVDIRSAIDYYIHTVDENGTDAMNKNYLLVTFDGVKWYFSAYDRDTVYGLKWTGKGFDSPVGSVSYAAYANANRVMNLIYRFDTENLKARAIELRDGIKSVANVATVFTNFTATIPEQVFAQNAKRWPLLRSTSASNLAQIVNWYSIRRGIVDREIEYLTGELVVEGNLIPYAQALDSSAAYNGKGYKNNAVWIDAAPYEAEKEGYVAVGLLTYSVPSLMTDVTDDMAIYIKGNIEQPLTGANDRIVLWQADKTKKTSTDVNRGNDYFDVTKIADGYYKMLPKAAKESPTNTAWYWSKAAAAGSGTGWWPAGLTGCR